MIACIYRGKDDNMCCCSTSEHHCTTVNDDTCTRCEMYQDKPTVSDRERVERIKELIRQHIKFDDNGNTVLARRFLETALDE